MTRTVAAAKRLQVVLAFAAVAAIALGVWIASRNGDAIARNAAEARLRPPDLAILFAESPIVVAHVLLALAALGLGPVLLLGRKGAAFHRAAGWTWVGLMAATAASTLLIVGEDRSYSFIHGMSVVTLALLPFAVHAARSHAVGRHRALMLWLYWLMLVGAAAFTLVPGRLIWRLFFG